MRLLGKALTFDDILLVPAFSEVLPKDTSLATRFTRNIELGLPLVSAAMDTVTEARLAITIAQEHACVVGAKIRSYDVETAIAVYIAAGNAETQHGNRSIAFICPGRRFA